VRPVAGDCVEKEKGLAMNRRERDGDVYVLARMGLGAVAGIGLLGWVTGCGGTGDSAAPEASSVTEPLGPVRERIAQVLSATDVVADQPMHALSTDPQLVNAWGIAFSSTARVARRAELAVGSRVRPRRIRSAVGTAPGRELRRREGPRLRARAATAMAVLGFAPGTAVVFRCGER